MANAVCPSCERGIEKTALFCPHCGDFFRLESTEAAVAYRLALLRRLIAGCPKAEQFGVRNVKRQVAKIQLLVRSDGALANHAVEVQLLRDTLTTLSAWPDAAAMSSVLEVCLPLLAGVETSALRQSLATCNTLVQRLQNLNKELAADEEAAKCAFDRVIHLSGELALRPEYALACVVRTPAYWPALAIALDANGTARVHSLYYTAYGNKAMAEKNTDSAQRRFEEALKFDPRCAPALMGLGRVFAARKEPDKAAAYFTAAIDAGCTEPLAYNDVAWRRAESGLATARELAYARYAVEMAPLAPYWDTLAVVHCQLGNLAEAVTAAREALREDPTRDVYRARLRELLALVPDLDVLESGSEVEWLESNEDEAAEESRARLESEDDFLLTPLENAGDDSEGGSQVFALEDDAPLDEDVVRGYEDDYGACLGASDAAELRERRRSKPERTASEIVDALGLSHTQATPHGNFRGGARDRVECTVFAPPDIAAGEAILLQVFVHLRDQAAQAQAFAQEFDPDATRRGATSLATKIQRGSKLAFELAIGDLEIVDRRQEIVWEGEINGAEFEIVVPQTQHHGSIVGTLIICQESIPIGHIKFKLKVVARAGGQTSGSQANEIVGEATRYQKAFISYAAEDRSEVLRRVQMLCLVGIECFQDLLSLDPGDRWERALYKHIDDSDVLFLFWSSAAKRSEWVEREWRYALARKGDQAVSPVIIEGPPFVPPPAELAHLHFNDRIVYFIDA